jgi:hypothetical protein
MASFTSSDAISESGTGGVSRIVKSYFYWTYKRGSFHYDVMVTLILLFIFVAPHVWDFGEKPASMTGVTHPIEVTGYGTHGLAVTVDAAAVAVPAGASSRVVKDALRKAIEPVTGDAVSVDRWMTVTGPKGNLQWKVWVHR